MNETQWNSYLLPGFDKSPHSISGTLWERFIAIKGRRSMIQVAQTWEPKKTGFDEIKDTAFQPSNPSQPDSRSGRWVLHWAFVQRSHWSAATAADRGHQSITAEGSAISGCSQHRKTEWKSHGNHVVKAMPSTTILGMVYSTHVLVIWWMVYDCFDHIKWRLW